MLKIHHVSANSQGGGLFTALNHVIHYINSRPTPANSAGGGGKLLLHALNHVIPYIEMCTSLVCNQVLFRLG